MLHIPPAEGKSRRAAVPRTFLFKQEIVLQIIGNHEKKGSAGPAQNIHAADGFFPCVHWRDLLYHVRVMSQPNVWIIDHRDSFTWNLAELAATTGMAVPRVVPNDFPGLEEAVRKGEKVILSPGPGVVHDFCHRATFRLLRRLPPDIPVLGSAWDIRS